MCFSIQFISHIKQALNLQHEQHHGPLPATYPAGNECENLTERARGSKYEPPLAVADGTRREFPLSASYITEQLFRKVTQGDHAVPPKHDSSGVSEAREAAEVRYAGRATHLQPADGRALRLRRLLQHNIVAD